MNNLFVIAGVSAVVFLIMKFIEMRFIEKENKPLKLLIRDALVVYISVVIGYFILEQLKPVMRGGDIVENVTQVFTDNPGF